MRIRVLQNILRRLKFRMRKQPESESPKVLITDGAIDNFLAENSENQAELEELLSSIMQDRIEEIQDFNESLRGRN